MSDDLDLEQDAREAFKSLGIVPTRSLIRAWIQVAKGELELVEEQLATANLAPKPPVPARPAAASNLGRPKRCDPQQAAFWQKLPRETAVRLAERHHLSITIRPDGSIVGLPADLKKLRLLLERRSKAKNKVQRQQETAGSERALQACSQTWRAPSRTHFTRRV